MKIDQPGSHLDQMLRQTRAHHVQLSTMADQKANMLLTMSSIIITLTAANLHRPNYRYAGMVLITFCLLTMGLAAFVAMPKIANFLKGGPKPDVESPRFNLLFFGDFAQLDYPDYEAAMEKMMNSPSRVYEAQVREVYTLGVFLAQKKYRYLRFAYLSFFTGLVASGVVMLISGFIL